MRRVLVVLLLVVLAGCLLGFLAVAGAGGMPSATLPRPLRFVRAATLDGLQVKSLEVASGGGPVAVSGAAVVGAPDAVPGGDEVAVLWRGVEVGRTQAALDGSFVVAVPPLPDLRISIVYGGSLPDMRSRVNVAALVSGHERGGVTASSWMTAWPPQLALNQKFGDMWNADTTSRAWLLRDLGREVDLSEVRLWFYGRVYSIPAPPRWARVSISSDGTSFVPVAEGTVAAPESKAPESPTMILSLPAGTRARWVKLEADSEYDIMTGLYEVAVLGKVLAAEVLAAPEWTLPGGPGFCGQPWVMGRYGQSGLPWGTVSGWPDAGACWMGVPGTAARFRVRFSVLKSGDAYLYAVGDDSFVAWLDGVPVLSGSGGTLSATPLVLAAGEHVLAFECSNSAGPGGLLVSLRGAGGQVLLRSGEGAWECEGNPEAWQLPGAAGDFAGVPAVTPRNPAWTAGPDPGAQWIWTDSSASSDAPAGRVRFRRPFVLPAAATVTVSVAVDNSARVWVDGVPVLDWQSYSSVGSVSFWLPAGDHVLAVEAANAPATGANPAGLLVSVKDGSGAVLLRTGDAGWQASGYVP